MDGREESIVVLKWAPVARFRFDFGPPVLVEVVIVVVVFSNIIT